MTDGLFEDIVDQLRGRPVEYLTPYLMADPLSDRKIFERVARLREALPQTHFEMSTTGKYLRPTLADRLLHVPLSELRISSHGITAEEYARTMPGVDFESAMDNIMRFIARWKQTRPYALSIVCLWGLWPQDREAQIAAFWEAQGVALSKWRVVSRARLVDLTVFGAGSPDPTAYRQGKREAPYACRFHHDTDWLHILSDGRVTLCCMDYGQEVILGQLADGTIEDIWNSDAYRRMRARVRGDLPGDRNFICHRCEWHVSESLCRTNPVAAGAVHETCE